MMVLKKMKNGKGFIKKEIIYNEKQLYNYGINKLAIRDYGRQELFLKMKNLQEDKEIVDCVLDKLENMGYLSDERRLRCLFAQYEKKESIHKTKTRVLQKGFTKEQVEEFLKMEGNEDGEETVEIKKGVKLLRDKFKVYDEEEKQKMIRFLAYKGYEYTHIMRCIKEMKENIQE